MGGTSGGGISFDDTKDGRISKTEPTLLRDALAGITVAFSLLSKAIACSAMVGANPLVGIWSSVVMGLSSPVLRARSGVICGAAAVVVVPLSALTTVHGTEYMTLCILLSAVLQGLFGMFRLAKTTADYVTHEVLSGFLNGLGGILFASQAKVFKSAGVSGTLAPALSVATLCYCIVQLLPRVTKAVPSSLVGLVVTSVIASALELPLATLSSTAAAGTFSGGLSSLPRFISFGALRSQATSVDALKLVLPASISIMIIALVETLLAGKVVKDIIGNGDDDDENDDIPTRSVLAMSAGNIISASLGGFGGCGLIPQSVLNIKSGGGGTLSSISYALAMASFVLFFAPLVGKIPEAVLAAIMLAVATDTVAWGPTLGAVRNMMHDPSAAAATGSKVSRIQRIIEFGALVITSYICYFGNLAVGIVAGVAFQRGLLYIYRRFDSGTK